MHLKLQLETLKIQARDPDLEAAFREAVREHVSAVSAFEFGAHTPPEADYGARHKEPAGVNARKNH